MVSTSTTHPHPVQRLVEHWRWRPEWTTERVCVWWYLTFGDRPAVASLAGQVGRQISASPHIDLVPSEWLHLSLGEVGFIDELPPGHLDDVTARATTALAAFDAFEMRVGPVALLPGAVVLQAHAGTAVEQLRRRLPRRQPGSVPSGVPWPGPEEVEAHISLAYVNAACERQDVLKHLTGESHTAASVVSFDVEAVTLAAVTRRAHHYEWTCLEHIALGRPLSHETRTGTA